MKKRILSSAVLLGTALIWGIAFVAQVFGARYLDPFTFNASRFLLGGIALIPICCLFERKQIEKRAKRHTLLAALAGGGVLFLASLLQQFGIEMTENPGKAGFITGLYTVLTPILYFLFFRRRSGALTWVGAVLAAAGLYLLCFDGRATFSFGLGELLLLVGAIFWALHIIVVDTVARECPPLHFSCGQFLVCGALNLVISFFLGEPSMAAILQGMPAILFCGLLSTGVGYTGQTVGQRISDSPTRAAILLSTESVFSAVGGLLWNATVRKSLHVEATVNVYGAIGCAVIFAAILLSQMPPRKKKQEF